MYECDTTGCTSQHTGCTIIIIIIIVSVVVVIVVVVVVVVMNLGLDARYSLTLHSFIEQIIH